MSSILHGTILSAFALNLKPKAKKKGGGQSSLKSGTGRPAAVREHVHAAPAVPRVDRVRGRGQGRGRERRFAQQRHRPSQGIRSNL